MAKYDTPAKIQSLIREIDDQVDALRQHGLIPDNLVISTDGYMALMRHKAWEAGWETPDASPTWRDLGVVVVVAEDIVEVVPNVLEAWEMPEEYLQAKGISPKTLEGGWAADGGESGRRTGDPFGDPFADL